MRDIEDDLDILSYRQIRDELERLEDKCDMSPAILDHRVRRERRDVGISELYRATIGADDPCDEGEERRLPCPTCSHERDETPGFDLPVEVGEEGDFLTFRDIGFGDVLEMYHGCL